MNEKHKVWLWASFLVLFGVTTIAFIALTSATYFLFVWKIIQSISAGIFGLKQLILCVYLTIFSLVIFHFVTYWNPAKTDAVYLKKEPEPPEAFLDIVNGLKTRFEIEDEITFCRTFVDFGVKRIGSAIVIYVPLFHMMHFERKHLEFALAHELLHVAHGDIHKVALFEKLLGPIRNTLRGMKLDAFSYLSPLFWITQGLNLTLERLYYYVEFEFETSVEVDLYLAVHRGQRQHASNLSFRSEIANRIYQRMSRVVIPNNDLFTLYQNMCEMWYEAAIEDDDEEDIYREHALQDHLDFNKVVYNDSRIQSWFEDFEMTFCLKNMSNRRFFERYDNMIQSVREATGGDFIPLDSVDSIDDIISRVSTFLNSMELYGAGLHSQESYGSILWSAHVNDRNGSAVVFTRWHRWSHEEDFPTHIEIIDGMAVLRESADKFVFAFSIIEPEMKKMAEKCIMEFPRFHNPYNKSIEQPKKKRDYRRIFPILLINGTDEFIYKKPINLGHRYILNYMKRQWALSKTSF